MQDIVKHLWNPAASEGASQLRRFASREIRRGGLVVVANREPYEHVHDDGGRIVVRRPPSGLVTGVEPLLRACGGTWIAHASGSADRLRADHNGRLKVPPGAADYTLRRVWIESSDYERYYSGFANEGLWPLCHTAHTRPSFRPADWHAYESVNRTFARAAAAELKDDGVLLVQDYHFALVPRLIRNESQSAATSLFWHIPWPNAEVFGICPWKESLLDGILGASIVGFHTRQYCLNFLESAQRTLECRADFEEMSVTYRGQKTLVRAYPISVEWPYPAAPRAEGRRLREELGIAEDVHVAVGVDRADYTKGLVERIDAIECLLEENPSLAGKYVLVQLASPTRPNIRKYQQLAQDLRDAVARVNERFGTGTWKPVLLRMESFSPDEVRRHYAMADSALVTPLHDGMNLVAKEYVAACEDGDGVLVLSTFAGAARELEAALLVNPYDAQQTARAILRAIRMPPAERKARMTALRERVAAHTIYDWAESLLRDLKEVARRSRTFTPVRVLSAVETNCPAQRLIEEAIS